MATDDDHAGDAVAGLGHLDDGLDEGGRIRREGDLSRVDPVFLPLVAATEAALRELLGAQLHSLYLYGSVPRGTAVPGRSDLDVTVVLHDHPTDADRVLVGQLADELDQQTDVVDEVGITVDGRRRFLSPSQRYDGAFHLSCLCTPLWGPDLAEQLPAQHPTVELARDISGDTAPAFHRLAAALGDPATARPDHVRQRVGRRLARLAFACVLFRWPGWTSDPTVLGEVVKAYYPERAAEVDRSTRLGWGRPGRRPSDQPGRPAGRDQPARHVRAVVGVRAPPGHHRLSAPSRMPARPVDPVTGPARRTNRPTAGVATPRNRGRPAARAAGGCRAVSGCSPSRAQLGTR